MERTIIEKVIKKYPQFRLKNKFSDITVAFKKSEYTIVIR